MNTTCEGHLLKCCLYHIYHFLCWNQNLQQFWSGILCNGLIYHRDCPERMCFPVGDLYIQTSCSLRGRLEYTPLGLDGYLSMDSNGELFKWRIAPYSQSRYFWKHINNISMHSLTCCAKMDSQIYVIHHKTRNISLELLYNPSWWHPCSVG